jgi:exosortase/archaeosortase family protein
MDKLQKKINNLLIRYIFMILIALPKLFIFYFIFTPLTIYPVYFLFELFFDSSIIGNVLFLKGTSIEIISGCVAGAAYYLLFILNMSIPNINIKKRTKMILFSFSLFLIINILRIFGLSIIYVSGNLWFDIFHKIMWYAMSVLFVAGIWFLEVKIFNIKKIPFYSDLKFLHKIRK